MANPILDDSTFRRDLPEARDLEKQLAKNFFEPTEARNIAQQAGLQAQFFDMQGPPSYYWASILDGAAKQGLLASLVDTLEKLSLNQPVKEAITRVRDVTRAGGSLHPTRLVLGSGRPFLARTKLRAVIPELQNWEGSAAILVVRGPPDSGRTETHFLLADHNPDEMVVLTEDSQLSSCIFEIWKAAGVEGNPPEVPTTQPAALEQFWIAVKAALVKNKKRLWIVFDDLDKGPGRVEVKALAEALAVRLKTAPYQKQIRLVLLGYPDPQLAAKIPVAFVREDTTEEIVASHVEAFITYCYAVAGKNYDPQTVPNDAAALYERARARVAAAANGAAQQEPLPFAEALNLELVTWHKGLT